MVVNLFVPCFVDQLYPNSAFNMVRVLEKLGCQVHYNTNQTCCGQPAFNAGYWHEARAVGRKFLKDFSGFDYVVSPGASCTGFIRNYYHKLFDNSAAHNEVKQLRKNCFEFTEFLTEVLGVSDVGASLAGVATYHDSCSALRECGIRDAPRKLLEKVKGLELREMTDTETCCGFGGTFAVKFESVSVAMADQKINHALDTGSAYLISTDLSCLLHLEGYILRKGLNIKTMHIADVLASGW
ncbi:MAG TPA: (Fe-S)-binding protein [Chitinophagaceae bacterium]|nr:(Fe-S)-binding protein [Chitinophagaceae bacterium]